MERKTAESVFARPASWIATLPALLAAGIAVGSALYCLFVIPSKLPQFYTNSLQTARESYGRAIEGGDVEQIRRSAGDMNVIYNRLVLLEKGDPGRYWQWAEFSRSYSDQLRRVLEQRKDDLPEEEISELQSVMSAARDKALDTFEYLSHTDSEFSELAFLNFVDDKVRRSFVDYSFSQLVEALPKLRELADSQDSSVASRSSFLYHQIGLETAWGDSTTSEGFSNRLRLKEDWLRETLGQVNSSEVGELIPLHRGYLMLASCLETDSVSFAPERVLTDTVESGGIADWEDRFAQVLVGIVEGEWNDVAFLLARESSDKAEAVRLGTARWICRLAVSEKAKRDAQWRSKYAAGLQIALQIAPQIPELAELVWLMAQQHSIASDSDGSASIEDNLAAESTQEHAMGSEVAGAHDNAVGEQAVVVPTALVEAVIGGQAVAVRHMVLALSNMLSGKEDVARSHLQLTQRSSGTLAQVAHVALGRLRTPAATDAEVARLVDLMEIVTELEANSGLNWFVLGVAYQRQGSLSEAEVSLAQADELLPDVEAIRELLESVRSDVKREERESQLRPVE